MWLAIGPAGYSSLAASGSGDVAVVSHQDALGPPCHPQAERFGVMAEKARIGKVAAMHPAAGRLPLTSPSA